MKNLTKALILMLAWIGAVLADGPVYAQNNPVSTAAMRLRIEKIAGTDWPAKVGVVDISPCLGSPGGFGARSSRRLLPPLRNPNIDALLK